ncbi:hypothetical protein FEM48_Zijuj01G0018800 [Ziziphus jujuba var. spinosa]|uniref:Protein At-4/1-like n=1 Tax=Ziziphus jujuba var. spinosa TaxID=714518 RepID=A0A978VYG1_ZIZJJ|nr:hypothetical protein FEM48_Zijuj01G0018800 [Ziziphus jujuba var. spinosa]
MIKEKMAATANDETDSLLLTFDQIYENFKSGVMEIQLLKSKSDTEVRKFQALEVTCNSLKQENERLTKLYTESLNNLANELEYRSSCKSLREELKRMSDEYLSKKDEHGKAMESLKQEYSTKIRDLEAQIRGLLIEKATSEATINHLRLDLAAHKSHIQDLATRLDQVHLNMESKYNLEIQDLKDCLTIEQKEKNDLNKKLRDLEKELLISRSKLGEKQPDSTSDWHVETIKIEIIKLRRENEILKQKLLHSKAG